MAVDVLLFGPARDCVGGTSITLDIALPAAVEKVVAALADANAELASLLPHCAIAVGEDIVGGDSVVHVGDEVAVLPPVSGGC